MIEIISVHIPKTAGTAFRYALRQVYGDKYVYVDNYIKGYPSPSVLQEIKVIHGHLKIKKYEGRHVDAKRIVWLRHPVERIVSLYFHMKYRNELGIYLPQGNEGIESFIEVPEFRNELSGYVNQDLEKFYFVGITELFEEDMRELSGILNWKPIQLHHSNANQHEGYDTKKTALFKNKDIIKKISGLNYDDMCLYHEALDMRARRLKQSKYEQYWWWGRFPLLILGTNATHKAVYKSEITAPESVCAAAGSKCVINVKIKNIGNEKWFIKDNIRLGNHWLDASGKMIKHDDGRAALPKDVMPSEEVGMSMTVNIPEKPGDYIVELDMLREQVNWFKAYGSKTAKVNVVVKTKNAFDILSLINQLKELTNNDNVVNHKKIQELLMEIRKHKDLLLKEKERFL